jgi:hypothetical protein
MGSTDTMSTTEQAQAKQRLTFQSTKSRLIECRYDPDDNGGFTEVGRTAGEALYKIVERAGDRLGLGHRPCPAAARQGHRGMGGHPGGGEGGGGRSARGEAVARQRLGLRGTEAGD